MQIDLNNLTILDKIGILELIELMKNTFTKTGDFREFLINTKLYTNPQSYATQIQNKWVRMFGYKSIAKTKTKEISIDFMARDSFSMFYYLRTIPLNNNEVMSFSSYEGRRIVHYNLQMTGTEIVRTNIGTFKCKVIRPYREGKNLFKNQGDMQIWISDDSKRLPVKIQIKMKLRKNHLVIIKLTRWQKRTLKIQKQKIQNPLQIML